MKSKWIKDLNVISETLKLLQKNIRISLEDVSIGDSFLNRTSIAQEIRAKIDKRDCIILKSFCILKETITRTKRPITE
jgi:hypothetical protein